MQVWRAAGSRRVAAWTALSIAFGSGVAAADEGERPGAPAAESDEGATPGSAEPRRFRLLAVASGDARPGRDPIEHCESSAQSFARALSDADLVAPDRRTILVEPGRQAFDEALGRLSVAVPDEAAIFYFCGRSSGTVAALAEGGVELARVTGELQRSGRRSLSVWDLLEDASDAGVGDAHSPTLTLDAHRLVQGHASIVARARDAAHFESPELGSAAFTFQLSQALRGLGDQDGDGQVAATEAFVEALRHAPRATLAGAGALSLTDLRRGGTDLRFADDLDGRLRVRDAEGRLLMGRDGPADAAWRLRVAPGSYVVELSSEGRETVGTRVSLSRGTSLRVTASQLQPLAPEPASASAPGADSGGESPTAAGDYPFQPFRLQFLPSFKPDVPRGERRQVGFGLGLVGSRVERLQSFQASLAFNRADEPSEGMQMSLGLNLAQSNFRGTQLGLGVNYVSGRMRGVQVGGVNVSGESMRGVQVGMVSLAEHSRGVQVGLVNSTSQHRGTQVGLVNYQGEANGVQVGLVNLVGDEASGVQVGLANLVSEEVSGVQVGLVNYADSADAQVGLLSVTRKGGLRVEVFASSLAPLATALRFDAKFTYSFLWAALDATADGGVSDRDNQWAGYGIGIKLNPNDRVRFCVDWMGGSVLRFDSEVTTVNVFRLLADWQWSDNLGFFGGPSLLFLQHGRPERYDVSPSLSPFALELSSSSREQLLLIPTLTLGVGLL